VESALDDFVNNWQPRQRQSFGMIATLAIRLQNLVGSHPSWNIYDLPSIALGALHLVLEDRLAGGWTRSQLIEGLLPLARRAGPGRPAQEHRDAVSAAVDVLLNRSGGGSAIRHPYGDWASEPYQMREKPLSYLLVVGSEEEQEQTLKVDARAINMHQGLYALDLEDRRAADMIVADRQLERGAVDEVVATVQRQHMTLQVSVDEIRAQITQMRRDVRTVDYASDIEPCIERILELLTEQLNTTDEFKDRVEQRLEPGEPGARQLMQTRRILEQRCHTLSDVLDEVAGVQKIFEEEQDRQIWTRYSGTLLDAEDTLFKPLLDLTMRDLDQMLEPVCLQLMGVRSPRVIAARAVVEHLTPRPRKTTPASTYDPFDVGELRSPPIWISAEASTALRDLLGDICSPVRLSALLSAAVQRYPQLCGSDTQAPLTYLLCLLVLTSFAPPMASEFADEQAVAVLIRHRDLLDPERVTVVRDGTLLDLPGVSGDDLLLTPAVSGSPDPGEMA
jgi:hypothetical protein